MIQIDVSKDEETQQSIPTFWRPTFVQIVKSLIKNDYFLDANLIKICTLPEETSQQIKDYIEDYGDKLIELPKDTWDTSVCIWTGHHWDVLIDLWTEVEGASDLALSVKVTQLKDEYHFKINMVFVP